MRLCTNTAIPGDKSYAIVLTVTMWLYKYLMFDANYVRLALCHGNICEVALNKKWCDRMIQMFGQMLTLLYLKGWEITTV